MWEWWWESSGQCCLLCRPALQFNFNSDNVGVAHGIGLLTKQLSTWNTEVWGFRSVLTELCKISLSLGPEGVGVMVSKEEGGSAGSSREVASGEWSLWSLEGARTRCHFRLASEIMLCCWWARMFWCVLGQPWLVVLGFVHILFGPLLHIKQQKLVNPWLSLQSAVVISYS